MTPIDRPTNDGPPTGGNPAWDAERNAHERALVERDALRRLRSKIVADLSLRTDISPSYRAELHGYLVALGEEIVEGQRSSPTMRASWSPKGVG